MGDFSKLLINMVPWKKYYGGTRPCYLWGESAETVPSVIKTLRENWLNLQQHLFREMGHLVHSAGKHTTLSLEITHHQCHDAAWSSLVGNSPFATRLKYKTVIICIYKYLYKEIIWHK